MFAFVIRVYGCFAWEWSVRISEAPLHIYLKLTAVVPVCVYLFSVRMSSKHVHVYNKEIHRSIYVHVCSVHMAGILNTSYIFIILVKALLNLYN